MVLWVLLSLLFELVRSQDPPALFFFSFSSLVFLSTHHYSTPIIFTFLSTHCYSGIIFIHISYHTLIFSRLRDSPRPPICVFLPFILIAQPISSSCQSTPTFLTSYFNHIPFLFLHSFTFPTNLSALMACLLNLLSYYIYCKSPSLHPYLLSSHPSHQQLSHILTKPAIPPPLTPPHYL